jgi:hypothetical protein
VQAWQALKNTLRRLRLARHIASYKTSARCHIWSIDFKMCKQPPIAIAMGDNTLMIGMAEICKG